MHFRLIYKKTKHESVNRSAEKVLLLQDLLLLFLKRAAYYKTIGLLYGGPPTRGINAPIHSSSPSSTRRPSRIYPQSDERTWTPKTPY